MNRTASPNRWRLAEAKASDRSAGGKSSSRCIWHKTGPLACRWSITMKAASALLLGVLTPLTARGELTVVKTDNDDGQLTTFQMSVTPAAEPVPALKHRLTLREIDLKQGNAAPYYYRAFMGGLQAEKAAVEKFGEEYQTWYGQDARLDELPLEKIHEAVQIWNGPIMKNLRMAAQRRQCDWGWDVEDIRGPELMSFLLQEVQVSRSLSRALILQTRLALAEKRIEDAIGFLRLNYRLSRDVAREPMLICNLVGIAIANMGNWEVIELIAQPGSPNLYWAMTELPRPFIEIRNSVRTEMALGLRTFPFILDAETAEYSPEEWSRRLAKAFIDFGAVSSIGVQTPHHRMTIARIGVTGMSMFAYPSAKQRLTGDGMDRKLVERMPVGKVIAVDSLRQYRRIADGSEKWLYVPFRVARKRESTELIHTGGPEAALTRGFGYVVASFMLPAIQSARDAEQRFVWQMNGIRTVEAIRMHAAKAGGLPRSLDEIDIVPLPENPATGASYEYTLHGETAVLDLPFGDGFPGIAWRFEITLRK